MALGPYCKTLGIDEEVLNGQKIKVCETKSVSNGVMWELKKFKTNKKLATKDLVDWLIKIFQVKCENSEELQEKLDKKLEALVGIRNTINKSPHKYRGELERLMNSAFDFPEEMGMDPVPPFEPTVCANLGPKLLKVLKEKGGDDDDSIDMSGHSDDDDEQIKKRKAREEIIQLKKDLCAARKVITSLNDKQNDLNKRCQILDDLSKSSVSERRRIETDIAKLKNEWNAIMVTWHDCMERLNHVNNNKGNYLDVGYMVRRNKTKQGIFDELSFEFEKTLEDFRCKLNSLIDKERRKKKPGNVSREYRQKSKSDRKRVKVESEDNPEENPAKKPCLSEEDIKKPPPPLPVPTSISVDEFMKSEKVDEFKGGKFVNPLKAIYIEFTSMPFPCNNVHEIIYSILDELEPLNTDKIPTPFFAANIYMEAHMAVSLQAFADLLKKNKISICNDGTTKFVLQDATYDVTLADETNLKLGVKDISKGSPDTSLYFLKDLLSEIIKVEGSQPAEAFVKKAKSFASEYDLLNKKLIEVLFLYKQQLCPLVPRNLDTLSDAFKNRVFLLNNYCTGLYFLLGLAKLADFTVLAWECMSFGSNTENLKNGVILSKTVQQIYSFCDNLNLESTEKISTEFREFVQKTKKLDARPLAPYSGDLFNVIFHNSAGIWFYHDTNILTEFYEAMKVKEISVDPLSNLLNEKHSFAFAKALGLVGKLVTVPLWTVLEDDEVKIGLRYSSMLKSMENWSKDASKFMKGQERLFDDVAVSHDAVYVSLIKDNETADALTKEILELLFTAFVPYIKFFLYGNATLEKSGENAMEIDSDGKKNIHDDFGAFDRITINIHSASTYAQDALTLYSKTRNGEWQNKLCNKENLKVFEYVEKDYNNHLKNLYKRKIKLHEILNQGQNLDQNSNCQLIEKKYKLIDDLFKWGGLWKSEKELDLQIKEMKENDMLNALRAQIQFRRHVLGEEHENGLLDLASEGECFPASKLYEHLKTILKKECELTEKNVLELATATDDEQMKEQVTKLCNNAPELKQVTEPGKICVPKENFHWLLGKLVRHTFVAEQERETCIGVCIARKNVIGACSYFIRYKGKGVFKVPDARIAEDLKNQSLKVIDPSVNDLVGSRLSRAFIKDDGDLEWHDCKVVGLTSRGSDYVVEFDFYGANAQVEVDVNIPELETFTFATRLLEEYRTDHLRLL